MKLLPLFFLGLLGLLFIALLSFKFNEPIIEHELTENTHEALLSEGMDWATPSANGQTIILQGIADSNELRLEAESIARAVSGVTQVNNQLTVTSSENVTHQPAKIMVNEGSDEVDSISAIVTDVTEPSMTESVVSTPEIIVAETEVGEIETNSIEPTAEITEVAETEVAVVTTEAVESIAEIAETEIAVVTVEVVEPTEPVEFIVSVTDVVVDVVESAETTKSATETMHDSDTSVVTETPEAVITNESEAANVVLETCQQQFDQLLKNEEVRFETNSAIFSDGNSQLLTKLAEVIESCPSFKVVIEGHTDTDGDVIANQILSEQRAYRVYDELVKRGIRSSSLLAVGYGESRPLSTDNTSESKAQNRRIELNVQEN